MKKINALVIFLCLVSFANFANAQTLDDIISKHINAMGGKEKLMKLSTAVMTGTFIAAGDTSVINTITSKKQMAGNRIDIEANGTKNYQVVTPKGGWLFTPVMGDTAPRPMQASQLKWAQVQLDIQSPFINSAEKGNKISLAGKDTVNGTMCYKIKVTTPYNDETVYSIDSKLNFIVKASTKMFQFGGWEDVVTIYGEYRKNADGFMFAYVNVNPRGKTAYTEIVTNVTVDENIFKIN